MLEQIMQLIRDAGEQEVVQNSEVPNEHNNAVMGEAAQAVAGTLQGALANGNLQEIMSMFDGDDDQVLAANPLSQQMQGSFADSVTQKLGLNKQTAMKIGAVLIPIVISQMVKRTRSQHSNDSAFNIGDLIGSLTGGRSGGLDIGSLVQQFTGGGQQQHGGLTDVIAQLTGGARQQQQSGGLSDLITNFFGR